MKKSLLAILAIIAVSAVSCRKVVPEPVPVPEPETEGVYILNNGKWGDNNSNIGIYHPETKSYTADVFFTVNGKKLGDLGQDILRNGDDVYIAVNGSKVVYVTDKNLKIKKEITATVADVTLSPRYFCTGGGKVYVSYYEGYLGEIDPAKDYAVRTTTVGPNPEGIGYLDGTIYVANSGGYLAPAYNNTMSKVDAATFKETGVLVVNTNPALVKVCGKNVYVSSFGNYGDAPAKVQCISDGTVTDLAYTSPSAIAAYENTLYVLCGGYDENWNPIPGTIYVHDGAANAQKGKFVTDGTVIENAYSIAVTKNFVFAGASDYKNNGDFYVFNAADGKLHQKFDTGGLNPLSVAN